jgi:malate dehydrogenase (oxaloacetate-decarboxylating)(NADP+)
MGIALLRDPTLNKGTAFSDAERDALGLRGLLPAHVCTQEEQEARVLENFRRLPTPLEKFIFLNALHDRNEALFFRLVIDNPDEMAHHLHAYSRACVPAVRYIIQRPRGIFVSAKDRGHIASRCLATGRIARPLSSS